MSLQFANLSGSPCFLSSGGRILHLPTGWCGSLNLAGSVEVSLSGETTVSTNVVPGTGNGQCSIYHSANAPWYSVVAPGDSAPVGSTVVWQVLNSAGGGIFADTFVLPNAQSVSFQFNVTSDTTMGYTITTNAWPSTTNYSTNLSPGSVIGSFDASAARSVQVSAMGLQVETFELFLEAVVAGFLFAALVSTFRFVTRILRTIPGGSVD